MQRTTPRLALAAAGAALVAALAAGCGSSSSSSSSTPDTAAAPATTAAASAPAGGPVKVSLSEWKIAAQPAATKSGKVTFDVSNVGAAPHEMVVIRTSKPAGSLGSGSRVPETGSVGETGDVKAGASKTVTLSLTPGHYALICNIPGHYSSGMHTDFTVS